MRSKSLLSGSDNLPWPFFICTSSINVKVVWGTGFLLLLLRKSSKPLGEAEDEEAPAPAAAEEVEAPAPAGAVAPIDPCKGFSCGLAPPLGALGGLASVSDDPLAKEDFRSPLLGSALGLEL